MGSTFQSILFEIEQGVATLTLNRPERLNSFNEAMHLEVREALDTVRASRDIRALVLTGAGRGFCTGQDLNDRKVTPGSGPVDLSVSIEKYYKPLVLSLRSLPIPVLAAVNGPAAGAGANIALACDVVVAARSAVFIQAFSRLGLIPDAGGTYFLTQRLGSQRALGLALFAEKLAAEQAEAWGLIWKCVDDHLLMPTVRGMAEQLAHGPTLGYARIKQAIHAAERQGLEQQLDLERDTQRELGFSHDYREGVAAFLEKRTPRFKGA
jgi:2-(1,2-epoxy-1,2-dihydrophenyl)acetyl-CoA isomerase